MARENGNTPSRNRARPRKTWTAPEVTTFDAAEASFGSMAIDDGYGGVGS